MLQNTAVPEGSRKVPEGFPEGPPEGKLQFGNFPIPFPALSRKRFPQFRKENWYFFPSPFPPFPGREKGEISKKREIAGVPEGSRKVPEGFPEAYPEA